MDGDAVREIKALAQEAAGDQTRVEIDDEVFTTVSLHRPPKPDLATALDFTSLDALAEYVMSGFDVEPANLQIVVASPWYVQAIGRLNGRRQREVLAEAAIQDPLREHIGRWLSTEDFVVLLQTHFEASEARSDLFKIVGNVAARSEVRTEDDGVSQSVTVTAGMKAQSPIPNPVDLVPQRSFRELVARSQDFVFRMRGNVDNSPSCMLKEVTDGSWEEEVMDDIREHLDSSTPGVTIL